MSILSKEIEKNLAEKKELEKKPVTNFMGGTSYEFSAIETLKMVTASSIFGEPQYYRDGIKEKAYDVNQYFGPYSVIDDSRFAGMKTSDIMETVIDEALSEDFMATLNWAKTLRTEYNMRLNPQIIMVRAAVHPDRAAFTEKNPGVFAAIEQSVMSRADEPSSQFAYYLYKNGGKENLPNILKKSWAEKLESLSPYSVAKYKNHEVGMINTIRVSHAHGPVIDELMRTGIVNVRENEKTWENLRSEGETWEKILDTIRIPHMALLRNLRNIFTEMNEEKDPALSMQRAKDILKQLKDGVKGGKQFPFRYYTAYKMLEVADIAHKAMVLDALEECIDIACDNMPILPGKTMSLSDNSGSAWGTIPSEYGNVTIAEIDNLSSVIAARNSDEGYVGKFGDDLKVIPVSGKTGVLKQAREISHNKYNDVGGSTENGIWLFLDKAIREKEHWDNIFIYSDMQAGHGGLYGTPESIRQYKNEYGAGWQYVDVAKLIDKYRKEVNPNVNVFSVQTAGYTNVVLPEYGYRTNLLYGWTGKELIFADKMNQFWNEYDNERERTRNKQKNHENEHQEESKNKQTKEKNKGHASEPNWHYKAQTFYDLLEYEPGKESKKKHKGRSDDDLR